VTAAGSAARAVSYLAIKENPEENLASGGEYPGSWRKTTLFKPEQTRKTADLSISVAGGSSSCGME
jgi:hypothetical protein